jgi:hypothetical protein
MSSTTFDLRQRRGHRGPWPLGTYLTDGERLLCVVDATVGILQLEDCSVECLESWPEAKAVDRLREVKPLRI